MENGIKTLQSPGLVDVNSGAWLGKRATKDLHQVLKYFYWCILTIHSSNHQSICLLDLPRSCGGRLQAMDSINVSELVERLGSDEDAVRKMAVFKLQ